jgi:predicted PurR-regulated permease PerM
VVARRKPFSMDHPIILTFLLIAIVASMSLAAEVLRPLALAVLLSFALVPLSRFLERHGLPRTLAVMISVVAPLVALGCIAYVVGQEINSLVQDVREPVYRDQIMAKIQWLKPPKENVIDKAIQMGDEMTQTLDKANESDVVDVRVVSQQSLMTSLAAALGPSLELLGMGLLVLILVVFLCMNREDLRDRIIQLFGRGRIALTTHTMDEVGKRISRSLAMFSLVNSIYGVIVCLGMWAIGVPYAVLWGFLAASLRFIPYAGPAAAFLMPLVFSAAHFPSWKEPLEVVGLFLVLELAANSFLEPVIYGKTTGVSAFGLLVAAMFWTWLWGALGLLLSTPMTVCLAVLGKYVPGLGFFTTLLGEESELEPVLRYYQRLLAFDEDGATQIVEDALSKMPRVEVFDHILVPALYFSERGFVRSELDANAQAFVWRVTASILDELDRTEEALAGSSALEEPSEDEQPPEPVAAPPRATTMVGVPASDTNDILVLRMIGQLLVPFGPVLTIIPDVSQPLNVAEQVAHAAPDLVLVSHVPPNGLASARYLVRRLRAVLPDLPILVGRWSEHGGASSAVERFTRDGATGVVFHLHEARDRIIERLTPIQPATPPPLSPAPVPAPSSTSDSNPALSS